MVTTKHMSEEDMMAAMINVGDADDLGTRIDKEQARARAGLIVKFGEGDEFTMRTIDFANTPDVLEHHLFPEAGSPQEPIHTVCPLIVKGQRCEYCERGLDWQESIGMKTYSIFLVQVLWVDFERVSILAYASNGASPIPQMRTINDNLLKRTKGKTCIDDCDLIIKQEGAGKKRKFNVDRQTPEPIADELQAIVEKAGGAWSKPLMIAKYIRLRNPELLGVGPEKEVDEEEDEESSDFHIPVE
jgi:hypothetical protein